jgi:hypothetical protein
MVNGQGAATPEYHVAPDMTLDAVVRTDDGFAVVWDIVADDGPPGTYFQRLDRTGQLVGERKLVGSGSYHWGLVAQANDEFGIMRPGAPWTFARLGLDGDVVAETAVPELDNIEMQSPTLLAAGEGYGLFWTAWQGEVVEAFYLGLDANGRALTTPVLLSGNGRRVGDTPEAVWVGDAFAVFWSEYLPPDDETWWVRFRRIDRSGSPLSDDVEWGAFYPRVAWNGIEIAVLFSDTSNPPRAPILARFDAFGVLLGSQFVGEAAWEIWPTFGPPVYANGRYAMAWSTYRTLEGDVGPSEVRVASLDCP